MLVDPSLSCVRVSVCVVVAWSCFAFNFFCDVVISLLWMLGITGDCERTVDVIECC